MRNSPISASPRRGSFRKIAVGVTPLRVSVPFFPNQLTSEHRHLGTPKHCDTRALRQSHATECHLRTRIYPNSILSKSDQEEHEAGTMTVTTPTIKLKPSGALMPQVGFGLLVTFQRKANCRWKVNVDTAADQVVNAIKAGYRLFDCAQDYDNEKVHPHQWKRS